MTAVIPPGVEQALRERRGQQRPVCAYVYDLARLRRHVASLMAQLPDGCRLFYAVKANSEGPVLRALSGIVHGFEVASLGEVEQVRAEVPDRAIVFGGPGKTDEELAAAVRLGVSLIHIESLHELRRLEHIASRLGRRVSILLRVNVRSCVPTGTLRMGGAPTQFGIDECDIPDAVAAARTCLHIDLRGFHFHSLSNNLVAADHVRLVEDYLNRVQKWAVSMGLQIDYLNAGGGIGVNYQLFEGPFDWPSFTGGIGKLLTHTSWPRPVLMFECGRYVTASCGYYAAEVLDIKRNHSRWFVIIRGGTHHCRLPASWQHSQPFSILPVEEWPYPFARPEAAGEPVTVVGQLCTPKDVLAKDCVVDRVRAGDIIVFHLVGAYGWSISHHDFLRHPHPDHVYLDECVADALAAGAIRSQAMKT